MFLGETRYGTSPKILSDLKHPWNRVQENSQKQLLMDEGIGRQGFGRAHQ
jgi:hypothetical protein